jgi:glycerophosphoryl diester phosphodiesterase
VVEDNEERSSIAKTINEISDMEAMKKLELDGIITDYPDRAIKIFRNNKGR